MSGPEYKKRFWDGADDSCRHAVEYLRKMTGVWRIGFFGLCGGAYSAMTIGASVPGIDYMILASMPVQDPGDMTEKSFTDVNTQAFLRNALKWQSWYKLLTGKSQYFWVLRSLARLATGRYQRPTLNGALWKASTEFLARGGRVLFVYAGHDPLYPPFADEYTDRLEKLGYLGSEVDVHVAVNCVHTFAPRCCQDELMDTALSWLRANESRREQTEAVPDVESTASPCVPRRLPPVAGD